MANNNLYTFSTARSPILDYHKIKEYFINSIKKCNKEIIVCSAYIKIKGINWLYDNIKNSNIKCRIISHWSSQDLLNKSSDLEVYDFCKEKGWKFEILDRLHAKFFLFDNNYLIVGSGNLTGRGMSLLPLSNREFGIFVETTESDLNNIQQYLDETISMTDDIYEKYKRWIEQNKDFKMSIIPDLPNDLKYIHKIKNNKIWVREFPWCGPKYFLDNQNQINETIEHEKELFEINSSNHIDEKILEKKFSESRILKWVVEQIKKKESKSIYFGELTKLIHESLFDDPLPIRKDIKSLQVNLYDYIKFFKTKNIEILKENYSELIKLKN
jgi:hypothetical protein